MCTWTVCIRLFQDVGKISKNFAPNEIKDLFFLHTQNDNDPEFEFKTLEYNAYEDEVEDKDNIKFKLM